MMLIEESSDKDILSFQNQQNENSDQNISRKDNTFFQCSDRVNLRQSSIQLSLIDPNVAQINRTPTSSEKFEGGENSQVTVEPAKNIDL